jgi:hypothetical protein
MKFYAKFKTMSYKAPNYCLFICNYLFLSIFFSHFTFAQHASDTLKKQAQSTDYQEVTNKKLKKYVLIGTVSYTTGLLALNELWYKKSPRQSFRFFNDNAEWKQVDKFGHFYTTYQLGRTGHHFLSKTNLTQNQARLYGGMLGSALMFPIEILDGFSADFGASWGDWIANFGGSAFYVGQDLLWQEQRIKVKFSYSPSKFAKLRPNVLGSSWQERLLKDYNGQIYWFSFDTSSFLKNNSRFPKFLNIALGYGADQLVFARREQNQAAGYQAYRQYYLSLDLDFSHIKTKSSFVKTVFFILDMVKLPLPTLEYNQQDRFQFHYFGK